MKHCLKSLAVLLSGLLLGAPAYAQPTPRMLGDACAGCHGTKGYSAEPMPIIAGQPREYLAKAMTEYRSGKRPSTVMGRLARGYNGGETDAMAVFFASQPWISPQQEVDPQLVEHGRKIHVAQCETCHRDNGRYSDPATPRLAGQWRRYLEIVMEEYWQPERKMPHNFMTIIISRLHSSDLKALAHFYADQR